MIRRSLIVFATILASCIMQTTIAFAAGVHFTYDGETGPAHWGALDPEWALCGSGERQSPINIPLSAPSNPADLQHSYGSSALNILNNGHAIQVNYDSGSTLDLDGDTYQLLQFHFHAASEHTVDGSTRPMELHLVHRNADGNLAVIGVFLVEGAENAAYAPIFEHLPPAESDPEAAPGVMVDADDLLPADQTYWRYSGSLTTPPCSEDVKWIVMTNPVMLGADQIAAFTAIYDHNARPVQPFNARQFIVGQQPGTLPETGGAPRNFATFVMITGLLFLVASAGTLSAYRRRVS